MTTPRWLVLALCALALTACEDPAEPDPDDDPEPAAVDVAGFRMMRGSTVVFDYRESDPSEADTLELTWATPIGVRFVFLDAAGDSVDPGSTGLPVTVVVTTPNEDYAYWTASTDPYRGTMSPGTYPLVETSFRVRLVTGSVIPVNSPALVLTVSDIS